jgi:WS/DGAT/MGAT family acyltransferase
MTVFKGELGTLKRAAWSAELPLCDVKAISREFGGTVNDVMLTIVTGALGRYLRASHAELHGLEIRATIPVNVRNPGTEDELGNCVGTLLLDLPLCVPNPAERLAELKRRMGRIKDSPEAVVTSIGLRLVGRLGARAQQLLVGAVGSKATLVVSNVRGPEERIYLAGAAVGEILAWVPKSGGLGISVSILSYAGGIRLGIITDAGLVPDPETLATGFEAEFEALLELAREMEEMTSPSDIMVELDDALETLDSLLKATVSESKSLSAETRLQCQASTKAGRQCKNRALPGSGFCHVHT